MTLFDTDLKLIELTYLNNGRTVAQTQSLGATQYTSINGSTYAHVVRIYVYAWDVVSGQSTSRDAIEALVIPREGNERLPRLDGPWLRYKMFTLSTPDEVPYYSVYDTKTHMVKNAAAVNGALTHAPLSWLDPTASRGPARGRGGGRGGRGGRGRGG